MLIRQKFYSAVVLIEMTALALPLNVERLWLVTFLVLVPILAGLYVAVLKSGKRA